MKNICVFSTACEVADKYKKDTIRIGKLIAKNKYNLVWGGTNKGLMKITADTCAEIWRKDLEVISKLSCCPPAGGSASFWILIPRTRDRMTLCFYKTFLLKNPYFHRKYF